MSQSLPNQVNDFNFAGGGRGQRAGDVAIPSKPGQRLQFVVMMALLCSTHACRNPFQTRSTTSIPEFQGRLRPDPGCRNPFQTRSTTSIVKRQGKHSRRRLVAIPSKPGQRLQYQREVAISDGKSIVAIPSKPGQRLQWIYRVPSFPFERCRNPFQTRSTTSITAGSRAGSNR